VDHPQGARCEYKKKSLNRKYQILFPTERSKDYWKLPVDDDFSSFSEDERECLSQEKVYWPATASCYNLLTQGPCGGGAWLVLEDDVVFCRERVCPCDPSMPDLCEVEIKDSDEECGRCRVALAAAQDGLCHPGEQLLVTPAGYGECGCIQNPVHVVHPLDNRCHPLYYQGPCDAGFMVRWSDLMGEVSCQPGLCGDGAVFDQGQCHHLGSQGHCQDGAYLAISSSSLEPECFQKKIQRLYDVIPRNMGLIKNAPLTKQMKFTSNCQMDEDGKCRNLSRMRRSRGTDLFIRRSDPNQYLKWMKSFRKRNRRSRG